MTEAVYLALIALAGVLIYSITSIILVKTTLRSKPTVFKFWTGYGHFEVNYDIKAGK